MRFQAFDTILKGFPLFSPIIGYLDVFIASSYILDLASIIQAHIQTILEYESEPINRSNDGNIAGVS